MKNIVFLIILLFSMEIKGQSPADPQEGSARNSILAVFGGSGIYTSLVYERCLVRTGDFQYGAKAGVGFSPFSLTFPHEYNVPAGIFLIYGPKNHHADLSLNVSNMLIRQYDLTTEVSYREYRVLFVPALAYRYQKPSGGFTGKIGISPVIYFNRIQTTISPWFELGGGWAF
jgi:hypothetical protein